MPWYDYILCFFAGTTLASGVPHFIKGICGEPFPSFAKTGVPVNRSSFTGWKSPGKGFSSPVANVLEGIFDFLIGAALFISGHVSAAHPTTLIAFIAGIIATSLILSYRFSKQQPPATRT